MTHSAETEISYLVFRYAEYIDAGDFAAMAELFREGAVVGPDGVETWGYEAVLALYEQAAIIYPDTGTPGTQHVTTNLIVEVDDAADRAHARSYFTVFQARPDFPLQPIICGSYRDEFRRAGGRWMFIRRAIFPRLDGDLSRHLRVDLPSA